MNSKASSLTEYLLVSVLNDKRHKGSCLIVEGSWKEEKGGISTSGEGGRKEGEAKDGWITDGGSMKLEKGGRREEGGGRMDESRRREGSGEIEEEGEWRVKGGSREGGGREEEEGEFI